MFTKDIHETSLVVYIICFLTISGVSCSNHKHQHFANLTLSNLQQTSVTMQWVYNATHDDVTAAALQYSIIVCPRPQEQCVYHAARVGERGEAVGGGGSSQVPAEYRELVKGYFEALSKEGGR